MLPLIQNKLYTRLFLRLFIGAHDDDGTLLSDTAHSARDAMTFHVRFGGSRICLRENRGSNPRAWRFLHVERRRMLYVHKNRMVRVRCISCYSWHCTVDVRDDAEEGFSTQITYFVYRK